MLASVALLWGAAHQMLVAGCSDATEAPERWRTTDERPLHDLVDHDGATAVLVVDPGRCLQCLGILAEWLERRRAGAGRFVVLLSRPPNPAERRILIGAGIPVDDTLARGPATEDTPMELVLRDGRTVFTSGRLTGPTSGLLRTLRTMSLEGFADSIEARPRGDPDILDPPSSARRR
jgi:hypothetical protein